MAVQFYHRAKHLRLQGHAKDQLERASYSIALNLAEGRGKRTTKDQRRFFYNAIGSVRECQAVLILENLKESPDWELLDSLAAHLYQLIRKADRPAA